MSSNLQISNSFTFDFTNTTNSVQTISLFAEGTNSEFSVINTFTTGQTTSLYNTSPTLPTAFWNSLNEVPFYFFGNPLATTIPQYPTSLSDISIKDTGLVVLESDAFTILSIPVTSGESMQVVNDRINQYLRDFATTSDFRSPSGQVMTFNFTFNFPVFQLSSLPITIAGYTDPYGISVQYPLDSTIRLENIVFSGSPALVSFTNIASCPLTQVASANGVEVIDGSNVSYSEIQQAQNGGALNIESLVLNIGNAPSDFEKQSQLLKPFIFKKLDVNGNEYEVQKVQVIDPYQKQYSYSKVDMTDDGENFILDGNTRFIYSIEPQTSVKLTYNYIQAKNSTFGTEQGISEISEEEQNIEQLDAQSNSATTKIFEVPTSELTTTETKNVSKKPNYSIPLLLGIIALIVLINSNQQKK